MRIYDEENDMMGYRLKVILLVAMFSVMNLNIAHGYNVYNNSNITLYVHDAGTCGSCIGCYYGTITPGSFGSCPGNDNGCVSNDNILFNTADMITSPTNPDTDLKCYVGATVPPHGWIEISGIWNSYDCSTMNCSVYDENGNVIYNGSCKDDFCG